MAGHVDGHMNGQMDEQMGWVNGHIVGWTDIWAYGQVDGCTD